MTTYIQVPVDYVRDMKGSGMSFLTDGKGNYYTPESSLTTWPTELLIQTAPKLSLSEASLKPAGAV